MSQTGAMTEQATTLRRYEPTDAAATLRCFRRAVRGTASRDYDARQLAAWAPADTDLAAWGARRAGAGTGSGTQTWVAERDGQLVGFGDIDASGYIDMMFVDPDAARTGVASALLGHLASIAAERGLPELTVHASITARPFFERHGFAVVAEQRVELRGSVLANFRMRRGLGD